MGLHHTRLARAGKTRPNWPILLACGELALWAVVFALQKPWFHMHHFTWWGVTIHVLCLVYMLLTKKRDQFKNDIVIQCIVISGVWYMSACECHMLVDAEQEAGFALYTIGNFFIHYVPMISACAYKSSSRKQKPEPSPLLLWLFYIVLCASYDIPPNHTYGCNVAESIVAALGICVCATALWITHDAQCAMSRYCAI